MIVVVDYGMGNLNSVKKALMCAAERANCNVKITVSSSLRIIKKADAIVLPGVGAFKAAMRNLRKLGLVEVLQQRIENNTPFLGICLGLQLLFEKSEEGNAKGFGIVKGTVKKFLLPKSFKIPHMGWNAVNAKACPIFQGIPKNTPFYFVHSYYPAVKDRNIETITTEYGKPFASGVFKKNLFAVQFHPEKSQDKGIQVLANFCSLVSRNQ